MQVFMIAVKVVLTILVAGYVVLTAPIWRDARRNGWTAAIDIYFLTGMLISIFALVGIWG